MATKPTTASLANDLRAEIPTLAGVATTAIFFTVGQAWTEDFSQPALTAALFIWLFAVMIWCAFGVVRHAEGNIARWISNPGARRCVSV